MVFRVRRVAAIGHALVVLVAVLIPLSTLSNDSEFVAPADIETRRRGLNDLSFALLKNRFDREATTQEFVARKLNLYLGSRGIFEEIENISLQLLTRH